MNDQLILFLSLLVLLGINFHIMYDKYCKIQYSSHAMPIPSMHDVQMLKKRKDEFHETTFQRS